MTTTSLKEFFAPAASATETPTLAEHLLVNTGSAPKLGPNSTGLISYAVLVDAARSAVYIALTGNDGGGYFSREIVALDDIAACLPTDPQPVVSGIFKEAFTGRSTNNAPFMAAAITHLGLLSKKPREAAGRGTLLEVACEWSAWQRNLLASVQDTSVELPGFRIKKVEPAVETTPSTPPDHQAGGVDPGTAHAEPPTVSPDSESANKPARRKAKKA